MVTEQIIRYVKLLLLFVVIWLGIAFVNGIGCETLVSNEMDPTYSANQTHWLSPKHNAPEDLVQNDVVWYEFVPQNKKTSQREFAARVIALPGDTVKIENGVVSVNGQKVPQTYVKEGNRSADDFAEIFIPRDTVFVLADNRRGFLETDSRGIGPVGKWAIKGRFESGFVSLFFQAMAFW